MTRRFFYVLLSLLPLSLWAQPADYTWKVAGSNSAESMPCGGGDIGMNVWTEDGDIVMYVCRSGSFDENNTLLKAGRLRLHVGENNADQEIIAGENARTPIYSQTLHLSDGTMTLSCSTHIVTLWVDVWKPVVHVEVDSRKAVQVQMTYESWRDHDHPVGRQEAQQCSYKWTAPKDLVTHADTIICNDDFIEFYHQNSPTTVFDYTVKQQGLLLETSHIYNPQK